MGDLFVNIALNLPIDTLFTYKVPDYLKTSVEKGKRVLVTFGKNTVTGIITDVNDFTILKKTKDIKSVIDQQRIITDELIEFCRWVSEYYITPVGEVLFSAFPRKINIKSEFYYFLEEDYKDRLDGSKLSDEILIDIIEVFERKDRGGLTKKQVEKKMKFIDLNKYFNSLTDLKILRGENYYSKPTKEKFIKIISKNFPIEELSALIKEFRVSSLNQIKLLNRISDGGEFDVNELRKELNVPVSIMNSLLKKSLIKIKEVRKHRDPGGIFSENIKNLLLNKDQIVVLNKIYEALTIGEFKSYLLFGVTGSGKTEVYINAIKKVIEQNKTAIVLVPEISLTPQLIFRFQSVFGGMIGVIHSRLSDGEKLDTYDRIKNGTFKIIIGARSALFAPLKNIGIIIVDEEHDASYKQENSPRYNGRDAAIYRAKINGAVIILGTATPSVESYYNSITGKHELLSLPERVANTKLPEIKIIDLLKREKTEEDKKDFFDTIDKVRIRFLSKDLIYEIGERLSKKESIIILQNRRGYHSYLECLNCGNVETCIRCSIALTYHKALEILKCHYCGYTRKFSSIPLKNKICSICNSTRVIPKGTGTERVEEELQKIFPSANIQRMDSDTLTSKKLYNKILKDFYDQKIDILAGTQVISKGLDFPNVTLVGVVNADIGMLNPDFRATEKTFQILTQVAGRSGRSENKGEVLIQTNHSDFYIFNDIKTYNYKNFYENEIKARKSLNYPPFSRLTIIETRSEDQKLAESKIKEIFNALRQFDNLHLLEVLPPGVPLFSKLKDKYRYHLIIKSNKEKDPTGKYLNEILKRVSMYVKDNIPKKVNVIIDVDAMNLL